VAAATGRQRQQADDLCGAERRLGVLRSMTGFKPMSGNCLLPATYLQFEEMEGLLQDQERTIIERRQRRLDAVVANQNKPGE